MEHAPFNYTQPCPAVAIRRIFGRIYRTQSSLLMSTSQNYFWPGPQRLSPPPLIRSGCSKEQPKILKKVIKNTFVSQSRAVSKAFQIQTAVPRNRFEQVKASQGKDLGLGIFPAQLKQYQLHILVVIVKGT